MAYKEEVKQQALDWLDTPKDMRQPKTKVALMRKLGISSVKTIDRWDAERDGKVDKLVNQLASLEDAQLDAFLKRVYQRAMEPKASARHMELYARMQGILIDKSEQRVKFSLDADELARINAEADRRAREFRESLGMANLPNRPILLSGEIRENQ